MNLGILPLVSIFVEPAKVLFLNNAINHGVFSTLGVDQVAEAGKSIFFLIETNPGPGLVVLLACLLFGKGAAKDNAPSAIIIHFIGGIHEIYFPYVLMNPILLLAVIAGSVSGVFVFSLLGAGLVASPSPGSILALMSMAPRGGLIPVLTGVVVSFGVSFAVSVLVCKFTEAKGSLEQAQLQTKELKGTVNLQTVGKIVFACDAGMGSSAMGATTLKRKLNAAGLNIEVTHSAIEEIPSDVDIVVTQNTLIDRVRDKVEDIEIIGINNFV